MWSQSFVKKVRGISARQAWDVWSDVNRWPTWQKDTEMARLDGPFEVGSTFVLKPKGGPRVKIQIVEANPNRGFTDLTRFPLAKMYGSHQFVEKDGELELTTTMSMEGPLSFLWRKLVAEDIVKGLPDQTDWLIEAIQNEKKDPISR